ncbi:hypothetical protein [Actinomadura rupiterrae]|uniref:hypothetical protein n=1 Tax=Actinomadura rupiterrae TaxID=559627 RepID=UPI0020A40FA6|nr:hypothetical protein [Actinomadura rupiterrae]MCP2337337.1 hypothetical protein [Actinomadura rupiterrae]
MSARPLARALSGRLVWDQVAAHPEGLRIDQILQATELTEGQFTTAKAEIWDRIAGEEGKAFVCYRGHYMITDDPELCLDCLLIRLRGIRSNVQHLLDGVLDPLGDRGRQHPVLRMLRGNLDAIAGAFAMADQAQDGPGNSTAAPKVPR